MTETGKMAAPGKGPPPTPSSASSNSLALVADKRAPPRPGGCASIFFQLFDWNRRLSNKKFFSRKLLPQVRAAKKISTRFAGDERMPAAKLLLIADENRGGFPSAKKAEACRIIAGARPSTIDSCKEDSICTPNLVARLMGLESMPAARHEEPRKALDGSSACYFEGSDTSGSSGRYQEGGGHPKVDRRPQKLQKTGFFDRRPGAAAARVNQEAPPFNRNALARSRKQRHPHRPTSSPLKSPRLPAGRRSSARLMEAATRILEPGMQTRSRAQCSLSLGYTAAPLRPNAAERAATTPPLPQGHALGAPLVSSCQNCGNPVQVPAQCGSLSTFGRTSSPDGTLEAAPSENAGFRDDKKLRPLAFQAKLDGQIGRPPHEFVERKTLLQPNELQERRETRQGIAVARSGCLKQSNGMPNEMMIPTPAAKLAAIAREARCPGESRGFISTDRNVSSSSRTANAHPPAAGDQRREADAWDKKKSSLRKRRSAGGIAQSERTAAVVDSAACSRQRGAGPARARPMVTGGFIGNSRNTGMVSSPTGNSAKQSGSVLEKKSTAAPRAGEEISRGASHERVAEKTADALSTLLEQKIKELTSLNQESGAAGEDDRSRSTAAILEELIAALTAARPAPRDEELEQPTVDRKADDDSCHDSEDPSIRGTPSPEPKPRITRNFQGEEKSGSPLGISHSNEYDQPSPVSILEASFSNDFDSNSGHRPQFRFMDVSSDKLKLSELDTDLSDSATSTNIEKSQSKTVPIYFDNIFLIGARDPCRIGYSEDKYDHVREIISNSELGFEGISLEVPDGKMFSPIDLILLDTLDTLLYFAQDFTNSRIKFSTSGEVIKSRKFLFDLIIEHLDVKYRYCGRIGYNAWVKLPVLTGDKLTREIGKEISNCSKLAGKTLDEIIEKDVSYRNGIWTQFEVELFEAGIEIENYLLQLLMNEAVIDLHC